MCEGQKKKQKQHTNKNNKRNCPQCRNGIEIKKGERTTTKKNV